MARLQGRPAGILAPFTQMPLLLWSVTLQPPHLQVDRCYNVVEGQFTLHLEPQAKWAWRRDTLISLMQRSASRDRPIRYCHGENGS